MTVAVLAAVIGGGALAGGLGAMLGLGGGVFLVPFLTLALDVPIRHAISASLLTVIATSSSVSAGRMGRSLINLRLGMLLEAATAAGGLVGGVTAYWLSPQALYALFGWVMVLVAGVTLTRLRVRNVILDTTVAPGRFGGSFYDEESGQHVVYRVKRIPVALVGSFFAGNVSSLLGIGGGIVKVPLLNAWCGVPLRAAAATSAFMIGVTAASGAVIYFGSGDIVAPLAAAAVLGVHVGTTAGLRLGARASSKQMKLLMTTVMLAVAVLMFVRAAR